MRPLLRRVAKMSLAVRVMDFCCGYNLRIGTIAVGCCYLVVGFAVCVGTFYARYLLEDDSNSSEEDNSRDEKEVVLVAAGLEALTRMLMSVALLYGVFTDRMGFLLLWLFVNGVCLFAGLAWIVLFIVIAVSFGEEWLIGLGVGAADAALRVYFLMVVNSYRAFVIGRSTVVTATTTTTTIITTTTNPQI